MCFRPPTVEMASPVCPQCGHENFIGVTVCAQCGAGMASGPVGTHSAESRDWTPGLEFQQNAAPAGVPTGAPKPPAAPGVPGAPAAPSAPKPPSAS
ncbi:hypothetical protein [Raoultibacter timonensis]|uniref:hypothetical protein n=1 Tax=Raoultibacter timonensis TaxID=1907662 RepID=UPI001FCC0E08|nr:hypothetical protein [Raoultibacter timonensis]